MAGATLSTREELEARLREQTAARQREAAAREREAAARRAAEARVAELETRLRERRNAPPSGECVIQATRPDRVAADLLVRLGGSLPFSPITSYSDPQGNRFTMDADGFDGALNSLAGLEGGSRPLYDAVRFAVDYTVQHAANTNRSVLVLTGGNDAGSTHSLDQAVERANQQGVTLHAVALSNSANLTVLADMAARTGGSISRAADARRLVSYYGAIGSLLSGSAQFYRTTWTLSLVGGNFELYAGYWIRTLVTINTPDGTLRVPFRLDFE